MQHRTTPSNITELKDNEIFVFGSNLAGIHGAGAAKCALAFGAKMGVSIGFSGETYALPTKDESLKTLPISAVSRWVKAFLSWAVLYREFTFLVTPIGCGLAGYTPEEIAPLFRDAVELDNVHLPADFWRVLNAEQ